MKLQPLIILGLFLNLSKSELEYSQKLYSHKKLYLYWSELHFTQALFERTVAHALIPPQTWLLFRVERVSLSRSKILPHPRFLDNTF